MITVDRAASVAKRTNATNLTFTDYEEKTTCKLKNLE